MATPTEQNKGIEVQATVIMRIPNLDTNELTALYQKVNEIINTYGGEVDISTTPMRPNQN